MHACIDGWLIVQFLAIPGSQASSERIFSLCKSVVKVDRTRLDAEFAGEMVVIKQNMDFLMQHADELDKIELWKKKKTVAEYFFVTITSDNLFSTHKHTDGGCILFNT